jgi:hypothetical protein
MDRPLTETNTNLPAGEGRPACKADHLTAICENVGASISQPNEPPWPVTRIVFVPARYGARASLEFCRSALSRRSNVQPCKFYSQLSMQLLYSTLVTILTACFAVISLHIFLCTTWVSCKWTAIFRTSKKMLICPCNRPWRPMGRETSPRQTAHRWRWGCQPYSPATVYTQKDFNDVTLCSLVKF